MVPVRSAGPPPPPLPVDQQKGSILEPRPYLGGAGIRKPAPRGEWDYAQLHDGEICDETCGKGTRGRRPSPRRGEGPAADRARRAEAAAGGPDHRAAARTISSGARAAAP